MEDINLNAGCCEEERPVMFPVRGGRDRTLRKARSILNRINKQNFENLSRNWLELLQDDARHEIVKLLIEKSLHDSIYISIYAQLAGVSSLGIQEYLSPFIETIEVKKERINLYRLIAHLYNENALQLTYIENLLKELKRDNSVELICVVVHYCGEKLSTESFIVHEMFQYLFNLNLNFRLEFLVRDVHEFWDGGGGKDFYWWE